MTLSGRPLLDTRPDQVLFIDRVDEMSRVRGALNQGLNCLVVGERGIGKTSLVRSLMFRTRQHAQLEDESLPGLVYVRGSGAESASELLARAADALALHQGAPSAERSQSAPSGMSQDAASGLIAELGKRAGQSRELASGQSRELEAQESREPEAGLSREPEVRLSREPEAGLSREPEVRLSRQREAGLSRQPEVRLSREPEVRLSREPEAGSGRVIMVLDDAPAQAGNALFGALRDELWSIDLRWLVTVETDESSALLRPPADAFFESRVELGPLAVGDSIEILRRRLGKVPDRLLKEAAEIGGGNPRRLLDVARQFSGDYSQWSAFSSAAADREKALAALGRPAHMLAAELEALGGASASDDRLLSRMGWTRPRAVQVLAEMERAGLVTASSEKKGQGRPRKVYKVVSAAQFFQRRLGAERQAAV